VSRKTITKEVKATVCDFCDLEVDVKAEDYCYAHINSGDLDPRDPERTSVISHFIFSWLKIPTDAEKWVKPNAKNEWVRYDFHAACFDKAMRKLIAERVES
jgi:hypothetical protein